MPQPCEGCTGWTVSWGAAAFRLSPRGGRAAAGSRGRFDAVGLHLGEQPLDEALGLLMGLPLLLGQALSLLALPGELHR